MITERVTERTGGTWRYESLCQPDAPSSLEDLYRLVPLNHRYDEPVVQYMPGGTVRTIGVWHWEPTRG